MKFIIHPHKKKKKKKRKKKKKKEKKERYGKITPIVLQTTSSLINVRNKLTYFNFGSYMLQEVELCYECLLYKF